MLRAVVIGIMLIFSYILQSTVLDYIQIWGAKPNLMIILTVYFALLRGSFEGGLVGLFGGILIDMLAGKVFGIYSLTGLYTGIAVGYYNKQFFKDNIFVLLFFMFIFTFFYEFLFYLMNYFIWGETRIVFVLKKVILPESIYNCILSIPIYGLVMKVNNWLVKKEKLVRKY